MARFDVFRNKNGAFPPLLLQVQSELHDMLASRVIVPLVPSQATKGKRPDRLMPELELLGETYTMLTQEMTAVPRRALGEKIGSLERYRYDIVTAVDFLLAGF